MPEYKLIGLQPLPQTIIFGLDRNINALVEELAPQCRRIFDRAANAASRSAAISFGNIGNLASALPPFTLSIRERTIIPGEVG